MSRYFVEPEVDLRDLKKEGTMELLIFAYGRVCTMDLSASEPVGQLVSYLVV
jgi:hypothetical protein